MPKSPDAFRTISEVADWLGIQAHVLRFWESKFTQVKPIKRAGGRRYYRPNDMLLLGGIRQLLHEDGLTIKGVQKILREEGMSHVSSLSQPLDELTQSQLEDDHNLLEAPMQEATPVQESAVVLSFDSAPAKEPAAKAPQPDAEEIAEPETNTLPIQETLLEALNESVEPEATASEERVEEAVAPAPVEPSTEDSPEPVQSAPTPEPEVSLSEETVETEQDSVVADATPSEPETIVEDVAVIEQAPVIEDVVAQEPEPAVEEPVAPEQEPAVEETLAPEHVPAVEESVTPEQAPVVEETASSEEAPATAKLPAFLRRPLVEQPTPTDNPPAETAEAETAEAEPTPPAPKPRIIDMPTITPIDQITATPAMLTAAFRTRSLSKTKAQEIAPLLDRLETLRNSMAASRRGGKNAGPDA